MYICIACINTLPNRSMVSCSSLVSARRQPRLINLHRNGQDIIPHSFQPTKRPAYRIASSSANLLQTRHPPHLFNSTVIASRKNLERRTNKFPSLSLSISKKFKVVRNCKIIFYVDYFWDHDAFQSDKILFSIRTVKMENLSQLKLHNIYSVLHHLLQFLLLFSKLLELICKIFLWCL